MVLQCGTAACLVALCGKAHRGAAILPSSKVVPLGSQEVAKLPLVAAVWSNSCFPSALLLPRQEGVSQEGGVPRGCRQPAFGLESELVEQRGCDILGVLCSARPRVWLRSRGKTGASVEGPDRGYFSCPLGSLPGLASHQLPGFRCLKYRGFWEEATKILGSGFSQGLTVAAESREKGS